MKVILKIVLPSFCLMLVVFSFSTTAAGNEYPDWITEARIYGLAISGLKLDTVQLNNDLDKAIAQGGNVIEADSRLSDYLSDEEFEIELKLISDATKIIHERGLKVVWYYPSLEVITANGRLKKNTMGRLHPEWLQLSFDREPGIFYGQKEFWVGRNDESAWMCPNSPYREWFKERLQRLAKTGVDGIWLDVPLFGLLVGRWGCTNTYCREKFTSQTGLQFPKNFNISDKRFWRYIQWRHETLTEFIEDCQSTISTANPKTITIAEVVSLDHLGALEWGTEGSSMKNNYVVWEVDGSSETTAMADASYDDWMAQYNIYKYCRGATVDRPSWVFCYGYDENDAQLVMAGAVAAQNNPYELRVPRMTTSVGMQFRGKMYNWIAANSDQIFRSHSLAQVAILYSERNRDFLDGLHEGGMVISDVPPKRDRQWLGSKEGTPLNLEYMGDYRGLSILMFQHQVPVDIFPMSRVNEELIQNYKVLVLPYMAILTKDEKTLLLKAVFDGATLIVSGPEPGRWEKDAQKRKQSIWQEDFGKLHNKQPYHKWGNGRVYFRKDLIGRKYLKSHDKKIARQMLSWLHEAGVNPWVARKLPVVVQPYLYKQQLVIHVLNYSWIGSLGNKPDHLNVQLVIPRSFVGQVKEIVQSEPGWPMERKLSYQNKDDNIIISLDVGINSLVKIEMAVPDR